MSREKKIDTYFLVLAHCAIIRLLIIVISPLSIRQSCREGTHRFQAVKLRSIIVSRAEQAE